MRQGRLDALGAEGPTWVIAAPVDVKAGQVQRVVVHFTLPQASVADPDGFF